MVSNWLNAWKVLIQQHYKCNLCTLKAYKQISIFYCVHISTHNSVCSIVWEYIRPPYSPTVSCRVAASERIVHLRTPKETTVGKIMDSCINMLGRTEDKSLFTLREKQGAHHMVFILKKQTEGDSCLHCTCVSVLRFIRGPPTRSADRHPTDSDIRVQTIGAALV